MVYVQRLLEGRRWPLPWMLAGGLTPENVGAAVELTGATQVDVSSGVEHSPGYKDPERVRAFVAAALAAAPHDDTGRKIEALCRIRGIGETSATLLAREVLYRRFTNRRQLASYVGLAPMPYQSGSMDRDRRISRAGNPRARTAIIQLAWLWLRYQPGSALAGWFRARVGALAGRTRRIAIVAMARKLLIALWRYAQTGLLPEGVELAA